jgi:hypothetical protein
MIEHYSKIVEKYQAIPKGNLALLIHNFFPLWSEIHFGTKLSWQF